MRATQTQTKSGVCKFTGFRANAIFRGATGCSMLRVTIVKCEHKSIPREMLGVHSPRAILPGS